VQPSRKAVEFSIDTEWKPKYFPTAELGFENVNYKNDFINYKSNAIYTRIGYDKNILKNDNKRYADMFFVGYRYGFSLLHQEVISYTLNDVYQGIISEKNIPSKTLQTHWLEFVVGTRAAITNAIFLGFSLRTHLRIYSQKDVIYPYVIPGFGSGEKKLTIGLNYSLYFQIPVMKVSYKKK
jgi:hypothetical protein